MINSKKYRTYTIRLGSAVTASAELKTLISEANKRLKKARSEKSKQSISKEIEELTKMLTDVNKEIERCEERLDKIKSWHEAQKQSRSSAKADETVVATDTMTLVIDPKDIEFEPSKKAPAKKQKKVKAESLEALTNKKNWALNRAQYIKAHLADIEDVEEIAKKVEHMRRMLSYAKQCEEAIAKLTK